MGIGSIAAVGSTGSMRVAVTLSVGSGIKTETTRKVGVGIIGGAMHAVIRKASTQYLVFIRAIISAGS